MAVSAEPLALDAGSRKTAAQPVRAVGASTLTERALLVLIMIALVMEDDLPTLAGLSAGRLLFLGGAAYILFTRPRQLIKAATHWAFIASAFYMLIALLIESQHPTPEYDTLFRVLQMFGGAVIIATLCRDKQALWTAGITYLIVGLWVSIDLMLGTYSDLRAATADSFAAATRVRAEVFDQTSLEMNLNRLAFISGQGAVMAMVMALGVRKYWMRIAALACSGICLIGAFLPLSRGGAAIACLGVGIVIYSFRRKRSRSLLTTAIIVAVALLFVPNVIFSRMSYTSADNQGQQEARSRVYNSAFTALPEYVAVGVGSGEFWTSWGSSHGFNHRGYTLGAHNAFLQVLISWGMPGLAALLLVVYLVYRSLPRRTPDDPLTIMLLAVACTCLGRAMVSHSLYSKDFSLAIGLIVGAGLFVYHRAASARNASRYPSGVSTYGHFPAGARDYPPTAN